MVTICSAFKLTLIVVTVMTLLIIGVAGQSGNFPGGFAGCENWGGGIPANAHYLSKSEPVYRYQGAPNEFYEQQFYYEGLTVNAVSYTKGRKQILLDVIPGSTQRFVHIFLDNRDANPNFALLKVKSGQSCSVTGLSGGQIEDIVLYD